VYRLTTSVGQFEVEGEGLVGWDCERGFGEVAAGKFHAMDGAGEILQVDDDAGDWLTLGRLAGQAGGFAV